MVALLSNRIGTDAVKGILLLQLSVDAVFDFLSYVWRTRGCLSIALDITQTDSHALTVNMSRINIGTTYQSSTLKLIASSDEHGWRKLTENINKWCCGGIDVNSEGDNRQQPKVDTNAKSRKYADSGELSSKTIRKGIWGEEPTTLAQWSSRSRKILEVIILAVKGCGLSNFHQQP